MKKSFFKRAVATAAAVPLALTQCLTSSFAETTADTALQADVAAEDTTITLESLLKIEADKQYSEWNKDLSNALMGITLKGNATGTIKTDVIFDMIAKKAGGYSALAENILGQVKNVQYVITNGSDIVITADVDNISDVLAKDFDKSLGSAIKKLAEEVGVPELLEIDYSSVDASGKIEIVISTSALAQGTNIPASFSFTPNGGSALDVMGSVEFAKDKLNEYKKIAYDKIDELSEYLDAADVKSQIDKSFEVYTDMIDKGVKYYNKALNYTNSKDFGSFSNLLAAVNAKLEARGSKHRVPGTGAAIFANSTVSTVFDDVLGSLNEAATPYAVDIKGAELGAFLDNLTDVKASAANGTYTLTGNFEDAEAAEVEEYYNSTHDDTEYDNSYKIFTGKLGVGSDASVDVQIERVINTKTKTTTTTTTSSSTTTTTSSSTTTSSTSSSTTTTTTTGVKKELAKTYAEVDSEYAFYYSYENSFHSEQIGNAKLVNVYNNVAVDNEGEYVLTDDGEKIVISTENEDEDITGLVDFGENTPKATFDESNLTFRYDVPLYYNGTELTDASGEALTAEAYIGVRGDVTLDNKLTSADATYMLRAYTEINSGEGGTIKDPNTVLFTRTAVVSEPNSILDHFAAFLGDADCTITDNWKATKDKRAIIGADATIVLRAATLLGSNWESTEEELWKSVLSK